MTAQDSGSPAIEKKIQTYLEALSPDAREMLVRGIESAKVQGDGDAHLEMILAVVRAADGPQRKPGEVETAFKAEFFSPLQPYLIDLSLSVRQRGRLSTASLEPIWTWLKRDVGRDLIGKALQATAVSSDPLPKAAASYAARVRKKILPMGQNYIKALSKDEDDRHRLAGQLGDKNTLADAKDALDVFQYYQAVDEALTNTPEVLHDEPEDLLQPQIEVINAFADDHPDMVHLLAVRYLGHVSTPAVLVRLARMASNATTVFAIEKSIYKPFVDVAWSEIDRCVEVVRARNNLSDRQGTLEEALLDLHRTVRRIQIAIDGEGTTDWGRRLSNCRRETSGILRETIEGIPGLVIHAVRLRKKDDKIQAPDADAVDAAREALKVLGAARLAIDSLALTNIVNKARAQVEQVIENTSKNHIERLRNAPSDERKVLSEIVEVVIEYARIVFGEEYADLVHRSLHIASTKANLKSA